MINNIGLTFLVLIIITFIYFRNKPRREGFSQGGGCSIPSIFGTGVVGGDIDACISGSLLKSGQSCNLKCDSDYKLTSGTTRFSCTNGSLKSASIKCSPITCSIPTILGKGIQSNSIKGCAPGSSLGAGKSCLVECKNGYDVVSGKKDYSCNSEGVLTRASLECNPVTCKMPLSFGDNIESGDVNPCQMGGLLLSGKKCKTQCANGYVFASGSPEYSCNQHGTLSAGTLQCKKEKTDSVEKQEIIKQNLTFVCDQTLEETTNIIDVEMPQYNEKNASRSYDKNAHRDYDKNAHRDYDKNAHRDYDKNAHRGYYKSRHSTPEKPSWIGKLAKVRPYDSIMGWWSN